MRPALTLLTAEKIATHLSQSYAERYLMWQKARQIGRPIIVSLLGASGVGKSTVATQAGTSPEHQSGGYH